MADDKTKRGPQDAARIDLSEDYEVRYWTEALGVNADRLREVVGEVGSSAAAVRERLAQK
jgi:hypothetical protein